MVVVELFKNGFDVFPNLCNSVRYFKNAEIQWKQVSLSDTWFFSEAVRLDSKVNWLAVRLTLQSYLKLFQNVKTGAFTAIKEVVLVLRSDFKIFAVCFCLLNPVTLDKFEERVGANHDADLISPQGRVSEPQHAWNEFAEWVGVTSLLEPIGQLYKYFDGNGLESVAHNHSVEHKRWELAGFPFF